MGHLGPTPVILEVELLLHELSRVAGSDWGDDSAEEGVAFGALGFAEDVGVAQRFWWGGVDSGEDPVDKDK